MPRALTRELVRGDMWYLYLDESGDLGFDFVNKSPSRYFTVCILATSSRESFVRVSKAVRKTLRRKVRRSSKDRVEELKGTNTSLAVKRYFWRLVQDEQFGLYSVTLNKLRVFDSLRRAKERIYNYVARLVIDQIPFEMARGRVQLVVDRSKSKPEVAEFNGYIMSQLQGRVDPVLCPVSIDHLSSQSHPLLQAADLFAWGIFRRYERGDDRWYRVFGEKIRCDKLYLADPPR